MLRVFAFDTCSSTNTLAKEFGAENPNTDAVFIAREQTAGVGRVGRKFHSGEGGLYISFLLHPKIHAAQAVKITALAAVALCRVMEKEAGADPKIKWVNDVYLSGKKAAGILTLGRVGEGGMSASAICGIGVNLLRRDFPAEIRDIATSVEEATGTAPSFCRFAAELIKEFLSLLPRLSDREIAEEYRGRSFLIGKTVTVTEGDRSYAAKVLGITDDFCLSVDCGGEIKNLVGAEVKISNFNK